LRKALIVSKEVIQEKIYLIRGRKVMVDHDLALLYGVETKYLARQVKRNLKRFPPDFMFRITKDEFLRCQIGTSRLWGGRRYLPYVFTEQGVAMLSGVLNSDRAIRVNIQIMRAFSKIREMLHMHKELWRKIETMEKKYDGQFKAVFNALRELINSPKRPKRRIGFHP